MRFFDYVNRMISNGYDILKPKFELPMRSTNKSAGYDFYNPEDVTIEPKEIKYVKTGVKCFMQDDEALILANRSSNPKNKSLILINGIGIVDADYYNNPDNEGEIAFAFMNISDEPVIINRGEKLGQGFFVEFKKTEDDHPLKFKRTGGFGSTGI